MKRSVVAAFSTSMLGALALFCVVGNAAAQQAASPDTFSLFEGPESTNLKPDGFARLADAIRRAQVPGECPLGKVTIFTPKGDPLFQDALAAARRDAVLTALDRQGLGVAGRLFIDSIVFGTATDGNDAQYDAPRDENPPTLRVNSTPRPGSKVDPNQRIPITIAARDDATRWETGIKSIQLVAESEDGRFIASENYPACSDPREKRVEAAYTVPRDPPPIVRLAVIVEDHAGRQVIERAEFPTGDWRGTLMNPGGIPPHQHIMRADFVLNHDGRGNLTGTMVGQTEWVSSTYLWQPARPERGTCFASTKRPHSFRISLVGSYTEGRSLKVFIENIEETPMIVNHRCPNGSHDVEAANLGFRNFLWYDKALLGTPAPLGDGELLADGSRQYKWEGPPQRTITVTLHRARS